jgi:hypothetical protein
VNSDLTDYAEQLTRLEIIPVIVDVFEIDLDIAVAHETLATFILSKNCESPLSTAIRLISVERLVKKVIKLIIISHTINTFT